MFYVKKKKSMKIFIVPLQYWGPHCVPSGITWILENFLPLGDNAHCEARLPNELKILDYYIKQRIPLQKATRIGKKKCEKKEKKGAQIVCRYGFDTLHTF